MKVSFKEILDAREAIITLSNQRLPIKESYNVSKIIRKADEELKTFMEMREKIIKKHSPDNKEDDHLLPENISPESEQEIIKEMNEALQMEVDIPVHKVDLSSIKGLEISPKDVMALEPFCIFETVELM